MLKKLILTATLTTTFSFAQTTLSTGDIAIIGLKGDATDQFDFVLLKDITTGTVINFTDNGWLASGSFRGGESTSTFTADQDYNAGTLFTIAGDTTDPRFSGGLNVISTSGDQIIAYQGSSALPTILFAVQSNSSLWQSDATSANTSALPTGLIDGTTAVAAGANTGADDEYDNVWYTGITTGTAAQILEAVADSSNWTGNNDSQAYLDNVYNSNFNITSTLDNDTVDSLLEELILATANGKVVANQGKIVAIFNLLGQEVINDNLDGIYIVIIADGNITKAIKVIL